MPHYTQEARRARCVQEQEAQAAPRLTLITLIDYHD